MKLLKERIVDQDILWLLEKVIESFHSDAIPVQTGIRNSWIPGQARDDRTRGLPLGNLTSQLLVNIYMHEFDQFAKHQLKAKYYIRYADDFVFFSRNYEELEGWLISVDEASKSLICTCHDGRIPSLSSELPCVNANH